MTKDQLRKKLDDVLEEYKKNVKDIAADPYGKRAITEGELVELQKQLLYTLASLTNAILDYLV